MGPNTSAELLFTISGDASQGQSTLANFQTVMGQTLAGMRGDAVIAGAGIETALGGAASKFGIVAGVLAGAVMAAGAALVKAAADAAAYAEEIDDAMDATGMTAEEISGLRYAAEQSGVEFGQLTTSLAAFAASIDKGAQGSEKQLNAFARMGISQAELKRGQQDMLPLLMRVADQFHANASAVEKTAIAKDLMTRGGYKLVEFLSRGSAGIRELTRDAERLGIVLSSHDVEAAKQFTIQSRALETQMRALKIEIGLGVLPILTNAAIGFEALAGGMAALFDKQMPKQLTAWHRFAIGFQEAGLRAVERIQHAMDSSTGGNRFAAGVTAAATVEYSRLSDLLEKVRDRATEARGEEGRLQVQISQVHREIAKGIEGFNKLKAEGKLSAEDRKREIAALVAMPQAISDLYAAVFGQLREKQAEAVREAGAELAAAIAEQGEDSYQRRLEAWDREIDGLREKYAKEKALTTENEAKLEELREAGRRRIAAERNQTFVGELTQLQQHLAEMLTERMTTQERINWMYEQDLQRYSDVEKEKLLRGETDLARRKALEDQFELNRAAAYARWQNDLVVLYNSQGWQGVFGSLFAEGIRGNEALLREWAESSNQSLLMVRVTAESLNEMLMRAFIDWSAGMGQNIAQAIVYKNSIGEAMRAATAATLASLAAEAYARAIYATALGFLRLAMWDFAGAANAFTAAAIFASVGTAVAIAGRAVAPAKGGASGGGARESGGAASVGGGGAAGGGTAEARPTVTVIVQGNVIGKYGVEELTEIINEAVQERDVKLVATQVKQEGVLVR